MKHLKAKLMASVGMLLVAVIMMSTASYAWFTISTNPEIANVTANITSNGNLEIALGEDVPATTGTTDSGNNNTWGNLIDLKQAFKNASGNVVTLKPVKMIATGTDSKTIKFTYPSYNLDGRISAMKDLNKVGAEASDTNVVFDDVAGVNWYSSSVSSGKVVTLTDIYAFSVDFWLRTNASATDNKVTLATATNRAKGDSGSEAGLGSYIMGDTLNSVTIAFCASETDGWHWYLASRTDVKDGKTTIVLRKATANSEGVIKLDTSDTSEAHITLKQNVATKVTMYVYIDGENMSNANAYLEMQENFAVNVQFEIDGLADAMNVNSEQNNGRNS